MIKIITKHMVIERHSNDIKDAVVAAGCVYITFAEGTRIEYPQENASPVLSALLEAAKRSTAKEVILDFTKPTNPLSIKT